MKPSDRYRPLVGWPGLPELLQRGFDTSGDGFGFLDPTVFPVVQGLDLTDAQYLKLAGINSFAAGRSVPAFAAQFSTATITNPATSQKIIRVRRITFGQAGATTAYFWGVLSGAVVPAILNSVVPAVGVKDGRIINNLGAAAAPAAQAVYGTTIAALNAGEALNVVTPGAAVIDDVRCVLNPGSMFFLQIGVANSAFIASISWEERQSVTPELTLPG